jgi:hypothetical protein
VTEAPSDRRPAVDAAALGEDERNRLSVETAAEFPALAKQKPRQRSADVVVARLTTVTVTCDGYCFEWCTALCATTPCDSS